MDYVFMKPTKYTVQETSCVKDLRQPDPSSSKAKTGSELVAFSRNSPLVGADLEFERDRSTGRSIDLG